MPIYEYRCSNCDVTFEVLVRGGDAVTCPQCGIDLTEEVRETARTTKLCERCHNPLIKEL